MKAVAEPLEGNKVKLSVEVDEHEFEKAVDAAFRKFAREVRLPGFRPGKAPRKLLEARIGPGAAREEALRDALPTYYAEALKQAQVDAIAPPEIDITGGQEDGPLAFDAVVEVRPRITVPGYQGLRVTVPSLTVSDDEVDAQIDRLRKQSGELVDVERPAATGDYVTIDLRGERDGEVVPGYAAEDYLHEVGSGSVVADLDERLVGVAPGETFELETEVDGAPVKLFITLKGVKEQVLPEVTDEWASEASEFDTVEELRADLRTRMTTVRKVQANLALRDEVVGALVELVADDAPEPLVNSEVERRVHDLSHRLSQQGASIEAYLASTGIGGDELLAQLRASAVESVKADLALRAVAEAEGLDATDDDVEAEIVKIAAEVERSKAEVRRQLERGDQMEAVRSDVRRSKALSWLIDHVEIVDESGRPIDRAELQPDPDTAPNGAEEIEA